MGESVGPEEGANWQRPQERETGRVEADKGEKSWPDNWPADVAPPEGASEEEKNEHYKKWHESDEMDLPKE